MRPFRAVIYSAVSVTVFHLSLLILALPLTRELAWDEIFEEWLTPPASLLRRCYRCLNVMTSLPPWIHATVSLRSLRLPLVCNSQCQNSSVTLWPIAV